VANRGRIRHAFRRPFSFSRKPKVAWVSDVFASESLSLNRIDINSLQLLQADDWQAQTTLINRHCTIRRVVANLQPEFEMRAQDTFHHSISFSLLWMLWLVDKDDTDSASIKTAIKGSTIQTARVLQTGVWSAFIEQEPDENASRGGKIWYIPPISIDWKGRATFHQDDQLLFSYSETHLVGEADGFIDNLTDFGMSGFTRTLISGGY